MSEEAKAQVANAVNERNAAALLGEIERLQGRVADLEAALEAQKAFAGSNQTSIQTLSDQVMGLLTWRAQQEAIAQQDASLNGNLD